MPRELSKTVMPQYVIEPPDILMIETIHAVPKSPYFLKTLDALSIRVAGTLPEAPIGGSYPIEPGGGVNLGIPYGVVRVAGMTVPQAREAIFQHLKQFLREPDVAVALAELGASQRIMGQYMVGPDGTVTLGSYGGVQVVGMSLPEAKAAIESHLSNYLENPIVSLDVFAYNSKVYYIVMQGAGLGDGVHRFPVTGNETVLDAIANINGLEQISSKRIWIARPTGCPGQTQIMPVDWVGVTENAASSTNYQILPGDRVFVAEDRLVAFDNRMAKFLAPLERAMGFTLLGAGTATRLSGPVLKGGGNPRGFGSGF
jgi:protein involved in polysaccharide export with SLBB domain